MSLFFTLAALAGLGWLVCRVGIPEFVAERARQREGSKPPPPENPLADPAVAERPTESTVKPPEPT